MSAFKKGGEGLYHHLPTETYYARIQINYKEVRRSLSTTERTMAKRKLADLRQDLERTDAVRERLTLGEPCERYLATTRDQLDVLIHSVPGDDLQPLSLCLAHLLLAKPPINPP